MNKIFALKRSACTGVVVAVSEHARGIKKGSVNNLQKIMALMLLSGIGGVAVAGNYDGTKERDYLDYSFNMGKYRWVAESIVKHRQQSHIMGGYSILDSAATNYSKYVTLVDTQFAAGADHVKAQGPYFYGAVNREEERAIRENKNGHRFGYYNQAAKNQYTNGVNQYGKNYWKDFSVKRYDKLVTEGAPAQVDNDLLEGIKTHAIHPTTIGGKILHSGVGVNKPLFENGFQAEDNIQGPIIGGEYRWLGFGKGENLVITENGYKGKNSLDSVHLWHNSRVGDSGSPLFYVDPITGQTKFIAVVSRGSSEHNYSAIIEYEDIQKFKALFALSAVKGSTDLALDQYKNKDVLFSEDNIHLTTTKNINAGHGSLVFEKNATISSVDGTHHWQGAGLDIRNGATVQWGLNGVKGDSLHKVGRGTLVINGQGDNQGGLNIGEGVVELNRQGGKAFDYIYITSGRGMIKVNHNNQFDPSQLYFGRRAGTLDLNGHSQHFNKINHIDEFPVITNSAKQIVKFNYTGEGPTLWQGTFGSSHIGANMNVSFDPQKSQRVEDKLGAASWAESKGLTQFENNFYRHADLQANQTYLNANVFQPVNILIDGDGRKNVEYSIGYRAITGGPRGTDIVVDRDNSADITAFKRSMNNALGDVYAITGKVVLENSLASKTESNIANVSVRRPREALKENYIFNRVWLNEGNELTLSSNTSLSSNVFMAKNSKITTQEHGTEQAWLNGEFYLDGTNTIDVAKSSQFNGSLVSNLDNFQSSKLNLNESALWRLRGNSTIGTIEANSSTILFEKSGHYYNLVAHHLIDKSGDDGALMVNVRLNTKAGEVNRIQLDKLSGSMGLMISDDFVKDKKVKLEHKVKVVKFIEVKHQLSDDAIEMVMPSSYVLKIVQKANADGSVVSSGYLVRRDIEAKLQTDSQEFAKADADYTKSIVATQDRDFGELSHIAWMFNAKKDKTWHWNGGSHLKGDINIKEGANFVISGAQLPHQDGYKGLEVDEWINRKYQFNTAYIGKNSQFDIGWHAQVDGNVVLDEHAKLTLSGQVAAKDEKQTVQSSNDIFAQVGNGLDGQGKTFSVQETVLRGHIKGAQNGVNDVTVNRATFVGAMSGKGIRAYFGDHSRWISNRFSTIQEASFNNSEFAFVNGGDIFSTRQSNNAISAPRFARLTVDKFTANDSRFTLRASANQADRIVINKEATGSNNHLFVEYVQSPNSIAYINLPLVDAPSQTRDDLFTIQSMDVGFSQVTPLVNVVTKGTHKRWLLNGYQLKQDMQKIQASSHYLSAFNSSLFFTEVNNMNKRMGDLRNIKENTGLWVRVSNSTGKGQNSYKDSSTHFQFGADKVNDFSQANLFTGITFTHTNGKNSYSGFSGKRDSYGVGLYASTVFNSGTYLDAIVKYIKHYNHLNIKGNQSDRSSHSWYAGLEAGHRVALTPTFYLEPQAELIMGKNKEVSFAWKDQGMDVGIRTADHSPVLGRVGLAAGKAFDFNTWSAILVGGAHYQFDLQKSADVYLRDATGESVVKGKRDDRLLLNVGMDTKIGKNTRFHLDLERSFFGRYNVNHAVNASLRYSF